MQLILDKILSNNWFGGVREDNNIFTFSLKYLGELNFLPKYYTKPIDRMLVPQNSQLIRFFLTNCAKEFHDITREHFTGHYFDLLIQDDLDLLKNFDELQITKKTLNLALEKYMQHEANTMQLFSFGMVATKNPELAKTINAQIALKKHDYWRNTIVFYEERFLEKLQKYLDSEFGFGKEIIEYITINEFRKYKKAELKKIILKRKKSKCIYYCIDKTIGIISDKKQISKIQKHITPKEPNELKGQVVYSSEKEIIGEVKIVKTQKELDSLSQKELENKILVTLQTTPHFVPYLKTVKAIITDEGGITCHASILSRELKIPCIVGTQSATKKLKDGSKIRMDLNTGEIMTIK